MKRLILLLAICGYNSGCKAPTTPEQVADKFVDFYFVEIDQKRALPLSSGLAHNKLEEELTLVENVRKDLSPDRAKPSVYWKRRQLSVDGDRGRGVYDITVKQGRDESKRHVLISLERLATGGADPRWTVSNFILRDGHEPQRPGQEPTK